MAKLYRDGRDGRRDTQDVSRLANVLALIGRLIEGGIADALVARRLEGLDHAGAERAAALLRVGKWHQAANELEAALEELAGAPDGSALGWFKPVTEQARDERRRLW